jgi:hypothetical protein
MYGLDTISNTHGACGCDDLGNRRLQKSDA